MKKPNYGQQQKMKTLDPVALAAYCKEKNIEMPQTSTPAAQVVTHPHEPKTEAEVVLTPVSDHEVEHPVTVQKAAIAVGVLHDKISPTTVTTSVTVTPPVEVKEVRKTPSDADFALVTAAVRFFDLMERLRQNAAHSVLNWDEIADLEAVLQPYNRRHVMKDKPPAKIELPEGQQWAIVVGEPMNRTQKFIRFQDEPNDAPHKMLHVQYSQQRYMGRKVRVKKNPDDFVGGYLLA